MNGPEITIVNWLLAASPVVFLVAAIVWLSWSVPRVGAGACVLALALALLAFGAEPRHAAIAAGKGISLSLFVLTIVWTSVYLYNVLDRLKAIDSIGRSMAALAGDGLAQALIIGWGFSSFIQGITGFGVPVAVAAPLLIMLGFSPARAAAMALVGHGWAVTFGSMASSYYTIQLVTGIEGEVIAPHMALLFAPVIVASGALVAHIQGGAAAVGRSLPLVVVVGSIMAGAMYALALLGAPQIASTVPGILGMVSLALLARTPLLLPAPRVAVTGAPEDDEDSESEEPSRLMPLLLALLPYLLLVTLSVISQIGPVMEAVSGLRLAADYPGFTTGQGFVVDPADNYAPISLLNHPAPLIVMSTLASVVAYAVTGWWRSGVARESVRLTYRQSRSSTMSVTTMVVMAVVMADTGMTVLLAKGIANVSGPLFPLVSPFIGLLGSFMSGSNTNSNVMFGLLQMETARALGIGEVTISSIQSIGASVGSSMAPAKVLVAAAVVGLGGQERSIFRGVIPYIIALVLLAGLEAMVVIHLLPGLSR
ncbi:MAG: L-lactate permease [Chloroflexota bacterium]|nr:L-lactate permease [Chloroflexota bacterium]MDE2941386.1 L-lactate permease [Chloroflexota bacterium]MDE3267485.1 L-lactate permease [Chloroflexota bacterium]